MAQTKDDLVRELDDASMLLAKRNQTIEELNKLAKERRTKIVKLKDVARFYRAQRDRVDAYLSAVLDMMDRREGVTKTGYDAIPAAELRDVVASAERVMKKRTPEAPRGRRPTVQEPFTHDLELRAGQNFAAYRDNEPERNWEDF